MAGRFQAHRRLRGGRRLLLGQSGLHVQPHLVIVNVSTGHKAGTPQLEHLLNTPSASITDDGARLEVLITQYLRQRTIWDKDQGQFKSKFAILPPAQPGITLPRGRATGTVSVDGPVL
jgi:hypothetical protein